VGNHEPLPSGTLFDISPNLFSLGMGPLVSSVSRFLVFYGPLRITIPGIVMRKGRRYCCDTQCEGSPSLAGVGMLECSKPVVKTVRAIEHHVSQRFCLAQLPLRTQQENN
jgi:hypothetical protein